MAVAFVPCNVTALAEPLIRVEGQPDAVRIEAHDASLREVFAALQAKFNLQYRARNALDRPVTGTYNGSLQQVAGRLLAGYDFALKITPGGIAVLVFEQSGTHTDRPEQQATAKPISTRAAAVEAKMSAPVMTAEEASRNERQRRR
jgi:hypothetical protein